MAFTRFPKEGRVFFITANGKGPKKISTRFYDATTLGIIQKAG